MKNGGKQGLENEVRTIKTEFGELTADLFINFGNEEKYMAKVGKYTFVKNHIKERKGDYNLLEAYNRDEARRELAKQEHTDKQ